MLENLFENLNYEDTHKLKNDEVKSLEFIFGYFTKQINITIKRNKANAIIKVEKNGILEEMNSYTKEITITEFEGIVSKLNVIEFENSDEIGMHDCGVFRVDINYKKESSFSYYGNYTIGIEHKVGKKVSSILKPFIKEITKFI